MFEILEQLPYPGPVVQLVVSPITDQGVGREFDPSPDPYFRGD